MSFGCSSETKTRTCMATTNDSDLHDQLVKDADNRVAELWRFLGREPIVDATPELTELRREAFNLAARQLEDAAGALANERNEIDICLIIAVERMACAAVLLNRIKQSLARGNDGGELSCAIKDLQF